MKTDISNNVENRGIFHKVGAAFSFLPFIAKKKVSKRKKVSEKEEFSSMLCPSTGALNRIGLRKLFDQMAPSDLTSASLILIKVENISNPLSNNLLQKFVNNVIDLCGSTELIARWAEKEFIIVCPNTPIIKAEQLANKICKNITGKSSEYGKDISCRAKTSAVHSEDLHLLIVRMRNS